MEFVVDYMLPIAIGLLILGMAIIFVFSSIMTVYYFITENKEDRSRVNNSTRDEMAAEADRKHSNDAMTRVNDTINRDRLDSLIRPDHYGGK